MVTPMADDPTPDDRPLYNKFTVLRNDAKDAPGEKHHGCSYFVLDLTHDKAVPLILPALADAYEAIGRPTLAADLRNLLMDGGSDG
jgi:hypothetical protein